MPVVLNTCRLRSDDLLTFACVPAEEMFLLWLHVSLPFGGSQNHCVRYTRALHFAQCFSSGMSRMSCATGSAPERSRHSQGVSTGCPGEPLRRDSGAPKFLDSPRSSYLRRLNLPRADPLRRNSSFFLKERNKLLLLVTTGFNAPAGAQQFHLTASMSLAWWSTMSWKCRESEQKCLVWRPL